MRQSELGFKRSFIWQKHSCEMEMVETSSPGQISSRQAACSWTAAVATGMERVGWAPTKPGNLLEWQARSGKGEEQAEVLREAGEKRNRDANWNTQKRPEFYFHTLDLRRQWTTQLETLGWKVRVRQLLCESLDSKG